MGLYADQLAADQVWQLIQACLPVFLGLILQAVTGRARCPDLNTSTCIIASFSCVLSQEPGEFPDDSRLPPRMSASPPPYRGPARRRSYSPSRSRSPGGDGGDNTTVFVGNLAHDMSDRTLREFFNTWGNVVETKASGASEECVQLHHPLEMSQTQRQTNPTSATSTCP